MGLKLNLIIGGIAIILFSGSLWYINYLQDQIAILKGNQIILEKEIEEQNAEILNMIAQNNKQNTLILEMEKDKNEAERGKVSQQIRKQAKELGIDVYDIPEFKKADNEYDTYSRIYKTYDFLEKLKL